MQKVTRKISSFILAAALITLASACTKSPTAPSFGDDSPNCYMVNGHLVCM